MVYPPIRNRGQMTGISSRAPSAGVLGFRSPGQPRPAQRVLVAVDPPRSGARATCPGTPTRTRRPVETPISLLFQVYPAARRSAMRYWSIGSVRMPDRTRPFSESALAAAGRSLWHATQHRALVEWFQFVPRYDFSSVPSLDRVLVPAGADSDAKKQVIAAWFRRQGASACGGHLSERRQRRDGLRGRL